MAKGYKHLTWENRLTIERMLRKGYKPTEIADVLGCCRATVYNELKRGAYFHTVREYAKDIIKYSPEKAEQAYQENKKGKQKGLKIFDDKRLISFIEHKIVVERYSPAAALMACQSSSEYDFNVKIKSVNTLYNYIRRGGVFSDLTMVDCPYRMRSQRKQKVIRRHKRLYGISIEERPDTVDGRQEFGHWEMDTVHGKRNNKKCLLVLTERKTRYEFIEIMKNCTAIETVRAINRIEKRFGSDFFKLFKTITVDNGFEFSNCKEIEKALYRVGKRTNLYYCHPYSSCERGSNENQNKLIRRWWPKGTDFDAVINKKDVKSVQFWINNYPRSLFNGKSSKDLFYIECSLSGIRQA